MVTWCPWRRFWRPVCPADPAGRILSLTCSADSGRAAVDDHFPACAYRPTELRQMTPKAAARRPRLRRRTTSQKIQQGPDNVLIQLPPTPRMVPVRPCGPTRSVREMIASRSRGAFSGVPRGDLLRGRSRRRRVDIDRSRVPMAACGAYTLRAKITWPGGSIPCPRITPVMLPAPLRWRLAAKCAAPRLPAILGICMPKVPAFMSPRVCALVCSCLRNIVHQIGGHRALSNIGICCFGTAAEALAWSELRIPVGRLPSARATAAAS